MAKKHTKKPAALPPDPEGMNDDRAGWAETALQAFMAETGTDVEDALSDLLCDLQHLCDRFPALGDFATQAARAAQAYEEETMAFEVEA